MNNIRLHIVCVYINLNFFFKNTNLKHLSFIPPAYIYFNINFPNDDMHGQTSMSAYQHDAHHHHSIYIRI